MTDREKVINGLNEITHYDGEQMFYNDIFIRGIADDTLALLKEQEEKTGHWVSVNDGDVVTIDSDGFPERSCFCSECKKYLTASDEYAIYGRYCPFCGSKMEGR